MLPVVLFMCSTAGVRLPVASWQEKAVYILSVEADAAEGSHVLSTRSQRCYSAKLLLTTSSQSSGKPSTVCLAKT
jgi:hypothetical protein